MNLTGITIKCRPKNTIPPSISSRVKMRKKTKSSQLILKTRIQTQINRFGVHTSSGQGARVHGAPLIGRGPKSKTFSPQKGGGGQLTWPPTPSTHNLWMPLFSIVRRAIASRWFQHHKMWLNIYELNEPYVFSANSHHSKVSISAITYNKTTQWPINQCFSTYIEIAKVFRTCNWKITHQFLHIFLYRFGLIV